MPIDHEEKAFKAAIGDHLTTAGGYVTGGRGSFGFHRAIQRDVLAGEHGLSERQAQALGHVLEHGSLTIQEYEELCPGVNRRTLQRDLRGLVEKGLLAAEGATNRLQYRLQGEARA